ncbi:MAG: hypothetical protein RR337_11570 [Clostridia bacterium]
MRRGVIIELAAGSARLLDSTGAVRSVPAQAAWRVGDVVTVPRQKSRRARWLGLVAVLMLAIGIGGGAGAYFLPYSLVSLDVNPSLELKLNRFDRVVDVRALNEQGMACLNLTAVKNLSCDEALTALFEGDYLRNYLSEAAYVTLTVQGGSQDKQASLLGVVNQTVDTVCAQNRAIIVDCIPVDGALVRRAHGCGITAGKYLAILELQAENPETKVEEYAHCGIGAIKAETARCRGDRIRKGRALDAHNEACQPGGNGYRHGGRKRSNLSQEKSATTRP